ncbi:MAG: 3-keto-5-aminohexanoate cleavage protein [Deltaproteobacteria bacterium]|nr:3-keto-5-aminohexanoate cleavage protein [Deltaproteobacteria bacterium]
MDRREFLGALASAGAVAAMGATARRSEASETKPVSEKPVILECAINGSTTKAHNPLVPETLEEQAAEILRCLDAGATIVHSHSNQPSIDPGVAAKAYAEVYRPVREKHPHAILYATANFAPGVYNRTRKVWPAEIQCSHHRILAEAGLANMVLLDMGVVPLGAFDDQGVPGPDEGFFWYGFWPEDTRYILQLCKDLGTGTSISVFEPGWMKNAVAMARAGTIPPGSKLNIYFGPDSFSAMAPPIPEALELYLKMIEGLDLKWSVGMIGNESIMDSPLARMALERGGSFRVGLEDWSTGPSNVEQIERAKEIVAAVGRPIVTGAEAIEYLDIPFAATRP